MRFVTMGDIHGNIEALKAVVIDALFHEKKIDGFIFLGDYCCDFLEGSECIFLIQQLEQKYPIYMISGNRETGMVKKYYDKKLKGEEIDWDLDSTMGAPLLSCRHMSMEQLAYLSTLEDKKIIYPEGAEPLYLQHRMPLSEDTIKMLKEKNVKNILAAHTHVFYEEEHDGFHLFNPGSVGLTDCGVPGADYAIMSFENNEWKMEKRHVDYDYQKAIAFVKTNSDLTNHCKNWGTALIASIESGLNVASLYMYEKNRIVRKYNSVFFKKYVNMQLSSLKEKAFQIPINLNFHSKKLTMNQNMYFFTDNWNEKGPVMKEEDWMYETALRNILTNLEETKKMRAAKDGFYQERRF